ncbi:MAG: LacI family transcriptional regulator [Betaproteobacteria bacterium RIFCSPLOWO2_12_FULL_62_13]|nr:MAG: LacI family transcriptional regulator [Betaproteobacteria bacterium RIFCSPLOWO2_12_FULL_62_13]
MITRLAQGWAYALLVAAVAGAGMAGTASAQAYPARAVRVIVPFAPGGGTDNLVRIMAPKMSANLGQQVIVDNRPGAGSQIGTELVAKAAPDGYTILFVDTSFTSSPSLYPKLPYDPIRDFAPVSLLASAPVVLIVHPSVPVKTLKELMALAKARPGELNFATGGAGSATHLGVELFKSAAAINLVHIPYKGSGPAAAAVVGGEVAMMFAGPSSAKPHVVAGRLRAIAITGEKRNAALPEVPTFVESGLKGVDSGTYWGSLAPAATPKEIIQTLSATMAKVLQMSDVRKRLIELAFEPIGSTPEEHAASIRTEIAKWARVVKQAKIRLQ